MKKPNFAIIISTISLSFFAHSSVHAQTSTSAKIVGWGMHYGGQVIYKYQVENLSSQPIKAFTIGLNQNAAPEENVELSVVPQTGGQTFWLAPSVASRPNGWGVKLFFPDESEKFALEWVEANYHKSLWPNASSDDNAPNLLTPPNFIQPNSTLDTFTVAVNRADPNFVSGHAMVIYGSATTTIQLQKGDSTPPSIELSVNRINENGNNGNWGIFEVQAKAKDNYDPSPTLVFSPITSNQVLKTGDFVVEAKHQGWQVKLKNVPGRSYRLSFVAQDASGNKAVRSFDYSVDENGKNRK